MQRDKIYMASPTMSGNEMKYIQDAFNTNWIAPLGPNVDSFEKELASYLGMKHATALASGTAALHLALKVLEIQEGDIIFCSSLTFSATVNPIIYEGAVPVFIDSERDTWNMCPDALKKAFEKYPQVKAVIVVNLYGVPAKLDEIMEICEEYNVPIIEDAAESLGAKYKGKQTGCFGKLAAFSFNGNKIITTSGGGMLVGEDEELICKARFLATQAREPERHYEHQVIGYNYRMSNISAGIGRGQLQVLDKYVDRKKELYFIYNDAFEEIEEIAMNPYEDVAEPNFWLSCMTIKKESNIRPLDILLALETENIESRPVWKPMHLQPVFQGFDFVKLKEESVSEDIFNRGVCLPSDIKNTKEDMDRIIKTIKSCF